jgi:hypothetical protein
VLPNNCDEVANESLGLTLEQIDMLDLTRVNFQ